MRSLFPLPHISTYPWRHVRKISSSSSVFLIALLTANAGGHGGVGVPALEGSELAYLLSLPSFNGYECKSCLGGKRTDVLEGFMKLH